MVLNLQNVKLEITAGMMSQFPKNDLPHLVFSGRSNVGKSSLINTLLGRNKLARVSSAPGKTITINFYNVDNKFYFVDLPGYGFAKRPPKERAVWQKLVNDYMMTAGNRQSPMFVMQLVDMKVGTTADDCMMLDWLNQTETDYMIVATKSDKLNKGDQKKALEHLLNHELIRENTTVIPFSALKGDGKQEIWSEINNVILK